MAGCKNSQQSCAQAMLAERCRTVKMPIANPSRPSAGDATQAHEQYELLRWVAELYYLQQQGQAEIATLIGASVSKVSRLLAEARRQGIVSIQVSASRVGGSEFERVL